jgi:hypothetical protein
MSTTTSDAIVLSDHDGRYYVIPIETLQDALVPEDAKAAVDGDINDVEGFAMASFSYVGTLSLAPSRPPAYGLKPGAWPCDIPAGAWPCDTPQIGSQQGR